MADLQKKEDRKQKRRAKTAREIAALLPKVRKYSHSKRHEGENLVDFRNRRTASNKRRKKREKELKQFS